MKKLIYYFLRKYIEKNYDYWGIKLETSLPPEFIITDHAVSKIKTRFNCNPDKMYKIMLKAWKSTEIIDRSFIAKKRSIHEKGIYKMFNGFIFVFRTRYNKRLGCAQKYLITVFKKDGYQLYN